MAMSVAPPTAFRAEGSDPAVTPLQPIVPLLRDSTLTEIMINGPDAVYVEREGKVLLTDRRFDDENHLLGAISALVATAGRPVDFHEAPLQGPPPCRPPFTPGFTPGCRAGPPLALPKVSAPPLR